MLRRRSGRLSTHRRAAEIPRGLGSPARRRARFRIALVCAEKEPLDCHRTVLVCRHLRDEFQIVHILADGTAEDHSQTEKRLVREMGVSRTLFEPDLTTEQLIQQAYDLRGEQIAYRANGEGVAS